jgi:regulatory protein
MAGRKKSYTPPPLTPERLHELAMRYVARYAASQGMLRKVLMRHLQKAQFLDPSLDKEPVVTNIDAVVTRFAAKGWVDDTGLATRMVEGGRIAGLSRQKIVQKLQLKGITSAMIKTVMAQGEESADEIEWKSALVFAKKKSLGAYRKGKGKVDEDVKRKEMGKICRAGFSPSIARKITGASIDELDE